MAAVMSTGYGPEPKMLRGIVALAKAVELAMQDMESEAVHLSALRDRLESKLEHVVPDILFNGRGAPRLPGTSNMSFPGVDGEALLFSMDIEGVAASTGSACTTGEVEPSHVLVAMGREPKTAQSSLRFSMGWGNNRRRRKSYSRPLARCFETSQKYFRWNLIFLVKI